MPFSPIQHVMTKPVLTNEQRAGILGDNADKLLKIRLSRRCASATTACDPMTVRQAEQFGVGGVFRTEETPLGRRMC